MNATPAVLITKSASTQTYYTIRLLADRDRIQDAYRAYGYFRWVDDILDSDSGCDSERMAFLQRQEYLLEQCYRGTPPHDVNLEEDMLVELVQQDREKNSGLRLYLCNMMKVMEFDVRRRGRPISRTELNQYTGWLSAAVTECIHYFVGHGDFSPQDSTRYLAVSAAHIVHMLRDTFADVQLGYYNIPREVLQADHMDPLNVASDAYRAWVKGRVELAREYFSAGKDYFARVENWRCRVACFAYIARFEWLLDVVEREGYLLRPDYGERKSARARLEIAWLTLSSVFAARAPRTSSALSAERRGKA